MSSTFDPIHSSWPDVSFLTYWSVEVLQIRSGGCGEVGGAGVWVQNPDYNPYYNQSVLYALQGKPYESNIGSGSLN